MRKKEPRTASHYLHTLPGVEPLAMRECKLRVPKARVLESLRLPRRNGLVLLSVAPEQVATLGTLRTAEDLFSVIAYCNPIDWGREGLTQMFRTVHDARLGQTIRQGQRSGRGERSQLRFRVIARMAGPKQPYGRHDLANAVAAALRERSKGHWRRTDEGEDVEIWANLVGRAFVCGVRLSDAAMRHREYQQMHMEASLRPSMAAALALLCDPSAEDVFLDPMCGAGTILIERALLGRHRLLLGGDIDREAISASRMNFGRKHKPRQLFEWDARALPLATASVDKLACNLPFGRKVQVVGGIKRLYQRFAVEGTRVLRPGGVAVLLTSESELLLEALDPYRMTLTQRYPVNVLGHDATIHVLQRLASG